MRSSIFYLIFLLNHAYSQSLFTNELEEIKYDFKIENGETLVTVPIPAPKGVKDFKPKIELFYRSHNQLVNSEVGMGWDISGIQEISRCPKSFYYDGKFDSIKYDLSDVFCLNGNRLILVKGQYGFDKSEYRTDVDSYQKIVAYGNYSNSTGPIYFKMFTKDNLILTFGQTINSTITPLIGGNKSFDAISKWYLNRIEDYSQNKIEINYKKEKNYCYLNSIKYANKEINFVYEDRSDTITRYYKSMLDLLVTKRLKSINLFANRQEIKRFELDYIKYGPSELSLLRSIKSCVQDSCSKPLLFDYEISNGKFSTVEYAHDICGTSDVCELKQIADMNGDGLNDIVSFGSDGVYVTLNNRTSFLAAQKWSVDFCKQSSWTSDKHYRYIVDMNNDGLPDIVGFGNDGVYVSFNQNGNFKLKEKLSSSFSYNSGYRIGTNFRFLSDLNNDGFPDIVGLPGAGIMGQIQGNTTQSYLTSPPSYKSYGSYPIWLEDVNADGFKEIVGIANELSISELWKSPESVQIKPDTFWYSGGWRIGQHTRFFADFNNDNLLDFIGFKTVGIVGISQIDSNKKLSYSTYKTDSFGTTDSKTQIARDINGDGFLDLISFNCDGVYVSINNGKKFNKPEIWLDSIKSCDSDNRDAQDMNGDRLTDLVAFYGNTVKIAYNLNKKIKLVRVTDQLDNIKTVYYSTIALENVNTNVSSKNTVNYSSLGLNNDIVVSVRGSDGAGGTNVIKYQYGPYLCGKVQGRQDCSFSWIKTVNEASNIVILDEFNYQYPLNGQLSRKRGFFKNITLYDIQFQYLVKTKNIFGVNEVLLQKKPKDIFDLNGNYLKTETLELFYDDFGNIYKSVKNVTDKKITYTRTTNYQYKNNETNWLIGQLTYRSETNIQYDAKSILIIEKLKEEYYEYNQTSRLLIKKINNPNEDVALEETFVYDSFGNVVVLTKKGLKSLTNDSRSNYFEYDSFGLNFLKRKNNLLHVESYNYDLNDNIIEFKDLNGLLTTYVYDKFGKKIKEVDPMGVETTWSYQWDRPQSCANSIYKITRTLDKTIKETKYYDSLDRVIRRLKIGSSGAEIVEDFIYDSLGQLNKQSVPYNLITEIPKYTVYDYDAFSREIKKTELFENGETIFTEYDGLKSIKNDHMGQMTISTKNILDQIISIEDVMGSKAYYEYDLFGNLLKIKDPQGSTISMTYDLNDRKITKNDTYMGFTYFKYNAFGELISSKHSTGREVKLERDSLGRVMRRNELEGNTTWIYDTSQNGKGKIHKVFGPSSYYSESKYDNFGRLVEQKFSYDKDSNYTVLNEYDKLGRLISQTYPSNVKTYLCYNSYGYLYAASMSDSTCNSYVWKSLEYNSKGNIRKEIYGNDIVTEYSYNDAFQMTNIKSTRYPSNDLLRNIGYKYDRRQNLIFKNDNDIFGRKFEQKYAYDNLNRLVSEANFETANNIKRLTDSASWMYDSVGNLIFADDRFERLYTYDESKPQQATTVGEESFRYDQYGNVVESSAYTIDWYSYSKAKSIRTANQTVTFAYGPERELTIKTLNNGSTKVHYIGNNYEKWSIRGSNGTKIIEKYFIKVAGKTVAIKVLSKNQQQLSTVEPVLLYFHYDGFSSVDSITDEFGKLVLKYNYTAFGKIKTMYSNLSSSIVSVLNAGYSGHDHIEGDRLVNMNGRIFDTVLLRFLSPDPFVQDIYNIQNLNRYSYGLNNPFKYKDPTGYFFKKLWKALTNPKVIFAIIVAVATAGLASSIIAPAVVASLGVASMPIVSAAVTGAVVGSTSAFASSMVLTEGNFEESLKAAAFGGIAGGIGGGLGSFLSKGTTGFQSEVIKYASDTIGSGTRNIIERKKFFEGIEISALSFAAAHMYKSIVGYEVTAESGGDAVKKCEFDPPVKGANNIGTQGGTNGIDPDGWFNEGGIVSRAANKIGGINAIAGMHDIFQVNLPGVSRDILNVPGMPVAAALTYFGLFNQI